MPQINDIRELAQQNARYVSNSPQDWMSYLDVAARLYRYSFTDTLLIHAQRPDATACAELELWNQKMSRWVNRGAKGIALLDDTGPRTKLRYVFDIADTHLVRGGKTPLLWNLDSHEHEQAILDHLEDTYGLSQTDSMNTALMELAQQLTADNLDEAMDGLVYEVADTFLEELDEDNIRVRFRELMTNSIFYALSRRCGQEPMDALDDDDFIRIVDFNKLPVLSFLGNAVSEQCEAVLFDIGREMRKIYKKEITQQLEKSVDSLYNTNTDFSTLKRKTKENTTKGGQENGVDVLPQGRLSVPESGREGRAADHREVRDAAQDVPEREPQELVSEYADERQAEPASGADRGSSGEPGGNPAGQPEREVPGTEQGARPAGMGGAPEQPDGDGRGDRLEGIGVQLTEPATEQDLSEAEEEIASAFSFPNLPTVEQQIRAIEAPIQARYADEIALDPEVVDEILRTGSNRSKGQLRLIYNFMVEKTPEEYTEFVKNEYGTGGKGFEIGGAKYAVWFDDLGLRIAAGSTARGGTIANAFLSWEDVSNRIHELLRQGEYAPQAVLDAARQNALQEHAQTLAYMERDLADGVAEAVFQDTEIFRGGFPELTDRLAGLLDDTNFLTDLNDRLSALGEAYAEDKDLMRMHFYKPDKVAALFHQFAKPYQNYSARDGFHWNEYKKFITEDEINAYFTRGSNYSDSRLAIYSFFLNHEDKKERADFLKEHYGIGGSSHALCGADDSHEDHDGRGIALERGSYGNPYASVHLNWNQAAGRIDQLIRDSEYLKPADYSRMRAYERERMAMRVMGFYHHLPNEVERPYPQDLYHEEGRKALVEKLEAPEQAVELLEQMDNALLSVPLDSEEYEQKAESLSILHQYVEGTYTIFPEKKRAVEIAVPEQGQISMFDFMEQEPQSKEQSTAAAVEKPRKDVSIADEKPSEQTLQPLPLDAANEYNALKERYPDALVGYEQHGNFEFYGEDTIIVKDLSRFGRDYIGVGEYMEQIFPLLGVRLIAINDNYDSNNYKGTTLGMDVVVSNLVNTMYCRDAGKKLRTANQVKWRKGITTASAAPFGYQFDPDKKGAFIIDPPAAKIVRRIFDLAILGLGTREIAMMLNDENVPVPSVYNKENKAYGKETTYTIAPVILWDSSRVWKILTAYVYTGAMVLGKTKTLISGKSIVRTVPKGQQFITEGTHEAIVSREEFEKAQLVIKSNSHKVLMGGVDFPLKGKVRCGNCRRVMAHNFKQVVPTFWCREGLELVGQTQCTSEIFQVSDIESAVFQALKKELSLLDSLYGDIQKEEQALKEAHKRANRRKTLMEQELKNLKGEKMRMYEEYAAGTLPLDTYKQKKQECDRRISEVQEQIEQSKAEESAESVVPGTVRAAAEQAENFLHGTRLTAGMVSAFIENVFVHDGGRIVVRFKYEQSIQDAARALHKS